MPHSERRAAIREIIAAGAVRSQLELVERLRLRGFDVTQSSVSRDLVEMRAGKLAGVYRLEESLAPAQRGELEDAAASIIRVRPAGPYLLVVHTPPGRAAAMGVALDRASWPEIVGTLAGDDTVLVATTGRRDQARVEARIARARRSTAPSAAAERRRVRA